MQKPLNLFVLAALALLPSLARADNAPASALDDGVARIRAEWGRIKYAETDKSTQIKDLAALESDAAAVAESFPARAEPKIWYAIALATEAGMTKSFASLPKLKKAKALLEESLKEDPRAIDGSAYTTLGSLYYQVPGWPVSFGNDSKAGDCLRQALAINPDGMDPNYFYGDYLLQKNKYKQAVTVLRHALQAKPRAGYDVIDAGRTKEINQDIAAAEKRLTTRTADGLN